MRNILVSILTIVAVVVYAHVSVFAESTGETETQVTDSEKKYFEALENQDQELMSSLLEENFTISSMTSDWSMNKEDFLKTLPKQNITSQQITETKVKIKGNRAYSQVDITMTKTYDGKDHSGDYEVYSIWNQKDGKWKLNSRKIKFLE